MKKNILAFSICLMFLFAGCSKTENNGADLKDGFKVTATSVPGTGTKATIGGDGLSVKWTSASQLSFVTAGSGTQHTVYGLEIDDTSISADSTKADFVYPGGGTVPAGQYVALAGTNYKSVTVSGDNIILGDGASNTQTSGRNLSGSIMAGKYLVSIGENVSEASVSLFTPFVLLEMPVTLVSNTSGSAVSLKSVSLKKKDNTDIFRKMSFSAVSSTVTDENYEGYPEITVTLKDTPELTVGQAYKVYMVVCPQTLSEYTVTIFTSAGDFTVDKSAVTLAAGKRYRLSGLDITVKPKSISSLSEWNEAVAGGGDVSVELINPITLDASAELPFGLNVKTYGKDLTIDVAALSSSSSLSGSTGVRSSNTPLEDGKILVNVPTTNKTVSIPVSFTMNGNSLIVNNGIMYGQNITLANNSAISGTGRVVLSDELDVVQDAAAEIASGMIISADVLCNNGNLTNGGTLYYGKSTGANIPASAFDKSVAQLANSDFDDWYTKNSTVLVGLESMTDAQNVWGSGNGSATAKGTSTLGANPTGSTVHTAWDEGNACMMSSVFINTKYMSVFTVKKFAAGNLFTGVFKEAKVDITNISNSGAKMTFGVEYAHRPLALEGYYDYVSGTVDYVNNAATATTTADKMDIYVLLCSGTYEVDTTDGSTYPGGASGDFASDSKVLAYGRLTDATTTGGYKKFRVELTYKNSDFNPSTATHILICATSSVDGGAFTGSTSSVLYMDGLQLMY